MSEISADSYSSFLGWLPVSVTSHYHWELCKEPGRCDSRWQSCPSPQTNNVKTTCSCRFILHNINRILSIPQPGGSTGSNIVPRLLQLIPVSACSVVLLQNTAARFVFNLPKFSHTAPLLHTLHRPPVAARIQFKTWPGRWNNNDVSLDTLSIAIRK